MNNDRMHFEIETKMAMSERSTTPAQLAEKPSYLTPAEEAVAEFMYTHLFGPYTSTDTRRLLERY